LSYVLEKDFEK